KRLSIAITEKSEQCLITKGALNKILEVCSLAMDKDGKTVPIAEVKSKLDAQFETCSSEGLRTLGIAIKTISAGQKITAADETGMTFLGILTFEDMLK